MTEETLMDLKKFCEFSNLKLSKGRKLIFNKEIPYYKCGSLIRIKKSDAIKWLESKRVESKVGNNE